MPLLWLAAAGTALAAAPGLDTPASASAPATPAGYTLVDALAPAEAAAPAAVPPAGARRVCTEDRPDAAAVAAASGTAAPASAPADARSASRDRGSEPAVSCRVFQTEAGRIEELRVRGQLQRVRVEPAGGGPAYEVQLLDAGRDPSAKSGPGRGGEGQRVWPLLSF